MIRGRSRVWAVGFCMVLLAVCSEEDPAITGLREVEQTDTADRATLIALYSATGGTRWRDRTNWHTPESIRNWRGVSTNSAGFVTGLSLSGNNLSGTLPPEVGDLTHLRRLTLYGNQLTGPIPPELGRLSELTRLDLRQNMLNGTIPAELGALSRLDTLLLSNNQLSGSIPRELGNLRALRRLRLGFNQLSGSLPPELGNLGNLVRLTVSRNDLTGPIPPEMGNLWAIQILSASRNNLTGAIPAELGNLAALKGLYLYENQLTGEIPGSLGNLSNLETLWIHENELSGALPAELGNLMALHDLRAANNGLSGELPGSLGKLRTLAGLELQGNALSGQLPSAFGGMRSLRSLWLEGNHDLSGLLPRSMLDLKSLQGLSYAGTGLCAQIDEEFQEWLRAIPDGERADCDVARVERLALISFHDMTNGPSWANRAAWTTDTPVAGWHGVATEAGRVVELALPANGLSGTFPAEIANLTELTVVDLAENDLSGGVPGAIGGLRELAELRVGRNPGLEGALPFALRRLERMRTLLHDNTGLCASPAPDFQAWYTAIEQAAGTICDNPDQVTVALPMVYLTQSVQTPSGTVRLVANREALLRAFVTADEPRGFFEPEVVAVFTDPAGDEVHRVVMTRDGNQIPAVADEGDLATSYNAVIPSDIIVPGVEMFVEVDPGSTLPLTATSETRFPHVGSRLLSVVEVPPTLLNLVPVLEAAEPDSSAVEWVRNISADSPEVGLLKHALPFAGFSVRQHAAYVTSLDLTTAIGQAGLFGELAMLRASEGGAGHYYGVAADLGSIRGRGQLPGWLSIGIMSPFTLAHEVGHNLSLRHAPCGGAFGPDPAFPYPDGNVGVWGYDFRSGSVVPPDGARDLMSYCRSFPWLSDYYFEKVIDHRAGLGPGAVSALVDSTDPPSDMLVLWGGVVDDELWIEPVLSMQTAARLPEASGPYRISGTTSDGRTLFSLDFTPTEDDHGGKHFFFTVPIEADWAEALERLTLTGPEGEAYVDRTDERRITVVTEPGTGGLRAILRDWEGALPEVLGNEADLEVSMTRGLREAVRLRR
ncbi:MAG: hypothetical protein F4X13_13375 [Gammaproteobacteria bacterium]|nr:hypothetical protein [Gammaproteobacteria bacterium]